MSCPRAKFHHHDESPCEECGCEVDQYGNTEDDPCQHCSFPDCGCDGARLCQAVEGASERACRGNVEGMYTGKDEKARMALIDFVYGGKEPD